MANLFTDQGTVDLKMMPVEETVADLRLRFEVNDTGMGISPEVQGALFRPFSQGDFSITRQFGGTGLGLSISKRLVELMGGEVGVISEPGQGSTFWFELPFQRQSADEEIMAAPHVTLAADGQQALQILKAQPKGFDVVLMDIQMPVMDGLTATRLIRQELDLHKLPVIALTAGVLPEEREEALNAGFDNFLAKPMDLQQMSQLLVAYVTRNRG